MSALLKSIGDFFVAPSEPAPAFDPPRPRDALAGVLAEEGDLAVAAGAAAAALRREARSPVALVCLWRGHGEVPLAAPAPGAPAASRLAAKLARRGLSARACGTLCVVELPAGALEAGRLARDAIAAAAAPAVLAVARRDPALDPVLAAADRLVVALDRPADALLAELAAADLARLGRPVLAAGVPRGLARHAARLGISRAPTAQAPPRAAQSTSLAGSS